MDGVIEDENMRKNNMLKVLTSPVSIEMRLEVGIPFVMFDWPTALIVAFVFVLVNGFAEQKYYAQSKFLPKLWILLVSCSVNVIGLILAHVIHYPWIYAHSGRRFFIDFTRAEAHVKIGFLILAGMLSLRILFYLCECSGTAWETRKKIRDLGKVD